MTIRTATEDDLSTLLALQSVLSEPNSTLLELGVTGTATVLVSAVDEKPVGYLLAFDDGDRAYIAELAVAPDHRREGRATELIETYVDQLTTADIRELSLTVDPENQAAITLYETVGFDVAGREDEFYENGDALVLSRSLVE